MSDSINQDANKANEVQDVQKEESFVSKEAYTNVSNDMHKYKSKSRELEARLAELEAEAEAERNQALEEQGKFKELYEKERAQREELLQATTAREKEIINNEKRRAVINKLGGLQHPDFASHINTDSIEVDEQGNFVPESLEAEVDRIRVNYSSIIKPQTASVPPSKAPGLGTTQNSINDMSPDELRELKRNLLKNR